MDITPDLSATVLDAVPAGRTGASLHEITDQVRLEYPAIRLTEVAYILLALRADSKVRKTETRGTAHWARRV
ncbi:MAG TPA: hypothetical protein VFU47_15910 [Armatimonadota bacterium]|nr:hypothetical protein [Armatimonadota bacterium]